MKLTLNKSLLLAIPMAMLISSCKKDKKEEITPEEPTPTTPSYNVPTTYSFTSQDFSSSTKRIAMLGEITTYIRITHTATTATQPTLDKQKLKDMYANANSQFTADPTLNTSGLQLKDKTGTALGLPALMDSQFDDAEDASITAAANPTVSTALSGTRGKLVLGTKAYLVDANGFEYKELAEKGIMGGVFYYQATTILTNIETYDNTTLVGGTTA